MHANTAQSKKIDKRLLIGGAIIILMALPSILTLAKIAIGLAMLSIGIIAFKITLKAVANTTKQNEVDNNHFMRDKVINIVIGLTSILIGGLSVLVVAQTGFIAICAALTALVLHEYMKSEEKEAAKKDQPTTANEEGGFVHIAQEGAPAQNEEKGIYSIIDEKLDEAASRIVKCTTDFCVSSIERFTPSESRQV